MRRIIKDIKFNGNTQYRVETNKIFFIIPFFWRTEIMKFHKLAIFETLDEARGYCCGYNRNKIAHKELIETISNKPKKNY